MALLVNCNSVVGSIFLISLKVSMPLIPGIYISMNAIMKFVFSVATIP